MQVCTIGYGHDYFACETIFAAAAHGRTLRSFDEYIAWMKQTHLPGKVFEGAHQQETLETLALFREAQEKAQDYLEEAAKRIMEKKGKLRIGEDTKFLSFRLEAEFSGTLLLSQPVLHIRQD